MVTFKTLQQMWLLMCARSSTKSLPSTVCLMMHVSCVLPFKINNVVLLFLAGLAYKGKVYDVSNWVDHPGGSVIFTHAGDGKYASTCSNTKFVTTTLF